MKGVYVLVIDIEKDIEIEVGALGKIKFPEGRYAYVGSAQNGLEARVKRHLSNEKQLFWHIDYLLASEETEVEKVFYKQAGKAEECRLAEEIQSKGKPIPDFGCSDCSCDSHLFKIEGLDNKTLDMEIFLNNS